MTSVRLLVALPLLALAAACVPSAPAPTPAPSPSPPRAEPSPTPTPTAPPHAGDWMDAPQSDGDWFYSPTGSGSVARFGSANGEARFSVVCERAARTVSLIRSASSPSAVPMRIRTETAERAFTAAPQSGAQPSLVARLPANDSFLDAMAFSKGRFAVEIAGVPALYLPAWPEISRVIDDCR